MRCGLRGAAIAVLALGVTTAAQAQQDGSWINLFDTGTLFGWTQVGDADWHVMNDAIMAMGGTGGMIATTSRFQDFELSAKIRLKEGCTAGFVFRGSLEGHPSENGSCVVWLEQPKGSKSEWRTVHVIARGDDVTVQADGNHSHEMGTNRVGRVGLLYHHNGAATVEMKDVKLRPLGLTPLFNGKDLSGWSIIPGHKSEFKVVDGAINITNGNGQIETDGVFRDFTLQLDIISNGEHLNSGVFFRTPPGVFWKGYESQVRNQWQGDDRSKPVDYGTGGNYGNQAARMVVPSDHQWFTKTIVCDGNHAAVWINGYQVSDYTDYRAISGNADGKSGYVADAGTINLQGHDPTTDLSFKNILIQEYAD